MAAWKLHVQKHNIVDTAVLEVCGTNPAQPDAVVNQYQDYFYTFECKKQSTVQLAYYWLAARPVLPQDCHFFPKKLLHYQSNHMILAMEAQKLQIRTVYVCYHRKKIRGLSAQ